MKEGGSWVGGLLFFLYLYLYLYFVTERVLCEIQNDNTISSIAARVAVRT